MKPIIAIIAILGLVAAAAPAAAGFKEKYRIRGHGETDRLVDDVKKHRERAENASREMTEHRKTAKRQHDEIRKMDENLGKLVDRLKARKARLRENLQKIEDEARELGKLNTERNVASASGDKKQVATLEKSIQKKEKNNKKNRDRIQEENGKISEKIDAIETAIRGQKQVLDAEREELRQTLASMDASREKHLDERNGLHAKEWDYAPNTYAPPPRSGDVGVDAVASDSAQDQIRANRKAFEDQMSEVQSAEKAFADSVLAYDKAADSMHKLLDERSERLEKTNEAVADALRTYETKLAGAESRKLDAEQKLPLVAKALDQLTNNPEVTGRERERRFAAKLAEREDLTKRRDAADAEIGKLKAEHPGHLAVLQSMLSPNEQAQLATLENNLKTLGADEQAGRTRLGVAHAQLRQAEQATNDTRNRLSGNQYGRVPVPQSGAVSSSSKDTPWANI